MVKKRPFPSFRRIAEDLDGQGHAVSDLGGLDVNAHYNYKAAEGIVGRKFRAGERPHQPDERWFCDYASRKAIPVPKGPDLQWDTEIQEFARWNGHEDFDDPATGDADLNDYGDWRDWNKDKNGEKCQQWQNYIQSELHIQKFKIGEDALGDPVYLWEFPEGWVPMVNGVRQDNMFWPFPKIPQSWHWIPDLQLTDAQEDLPERGGIPSEDVMVRENFPENTNSRDPNHPMLPDTHTNVVDIHTIRKHIPKDLYNVEKEDYKFDELVWKFKVSPDDDYLTEPGWILNPDGNYEVVDRFQHTDVLKMSGAKKSVSRPFAPNQSGGCELYFAFEEGGSPGDSLGISILPAVMNIREVDPASSDLLLYEGGIPSIQTGSDSVEKTLPSVENEYTYELRLNPDTLPSGSPHKYILKTGDTTNGLQIYCDQEMRVGVKIYEGGTEYELLSQTPLIGGWHHIGITFSDYRTRLFINGEEEASNTEDMTPAIDAISAIGIGDLTGTGNSLCGQYDDLAVWRTEKPSFLNECIRITCDLSDPKLELETPSGNILGPTLGAGKWHHLALTWSGVSEKVLIRLNGRYLRTPDDSIELDWSNSGKSPQSLQLRADTSIDTHCYFDAIGVYNQGYSQFGNVKTPFKDAINYKIPADKIIPAEALTAQYGDGVGSIAIENVLDHQSAIKIKAEQDDVGTGYIHNARSEGYWSCLIYHPTIDAFHNVMFGLINQTAGTVAAFKIDDYYEIKILKDGAELEEIRLSDINSEWVPDALDFHNFCFHKSGKTVNFYIDDVLVYSGELFEDYDILFSSLSVHTEDPASPALGYYDRLYVGDSRELASFSRPSGGKKFHRCYTFYSGRDSREEWVSAWINIPNWTKNILPFEDLSEGDGRAVIGAEGGTETLILTKNPIHGAAKVRYPVPLSDGSLSIVFKCKNVSLPGAMKINCMTGDGREVASITISKGKLFASNGDESPIELLDPIWPHKEYSLDLNFRTFSGNISLQNLSQNYDITLIDDQEHVIGNASPRLSVDNLLGNNFYISIESYEYQIDAPYNIYIKKFGSFLGEEAGEDDSEHYLDLRMHGKNYDAIGPCIKFGKESSNRPGWRPIYAIQDGKNGMFCSTETHTGMYIKSNEHELVSLKYYCMDPVDPRDPRNLTYELYIGTDFRLAGIFRFALEGGDPEYLDTVMLSASDITGDDCRILFDGLGISSEHFERGRNVGSGVTGANSLVADENLISYGNFTSKGKATFNKMVKLTSGLILEADENFKKDPAVVDRNWFPGQTPPFWTSHHGKVVMYDEHRSHLNVLKLETALDNQGDPVDLTSAYQPFAERTWGPSGVGEPQEKGYFSAYLGVGESKDPGAAVVKSSVTLYLLSDSEFPRNQDTGRPFLRENKSEYTGPEDITPYAAAFEYSNQDGLIRWYNYDPTTNYNNGAFTGEGGNILTNVGPDKLVHIAVTWDLTKAADNCHVWIDGVYVAKITINETINEAPLGAIDTVLITAGGEKEFTSDAVQGTTNRTKPVAYFDAFISTLNDIDLGLIDHIIQEGDLMARQSSMFNNIQGLLRSSTGLIERIRIGSKGQTDLFIDENNHISYVRHNHAETDLAIEESDKGYRIIKIFTLAGLNWWNSNMKPYDHVFIMDDLGTLTEIITITVDRVIMEGGKFAVSGDEYISIQAENIILRDIDVDATGCNNNSDRIIYIDPDNGAKYVLIDYVTIIGDGEHGHGIEISSSSNTNTDCKITNCGISHLWHGIYLNNSSNNKIYKNDCSFNLINGIRILSSSNENILASNTFRNNEAGILIGDSSNLNKVEGNHCLSNRGTGIIMGSSTVVDGPNILSNNKCLNNGGHGIGINNYNGGTISNNNCSENGACGILIVNSNRILIQGNNVFNNSADQEQDLSNIYLGENCAHNSLSGNKTHNQAGNSTSFGIQVEGDSNYLFSNICEDRISVSSYNELKKNQIGSLKGEIIYHINVSPGMIYHGGGTCGVAGNHPPIGIGVANNLLLIHGKIASGEVGTLSISGCAGCAGDLAYIIDSTTVSNNHSSIDSGNYIKIIGTFISETEIMVNPSPIVMEKR